MISRTSKWLVSLGGCSLLAIAYATWSARIDAELPRPEGPWLAQVEAAENAIGREVPSDPPSVGSSADAVDGTLAAPAVVGRTVATVLTAKDLPAARWVEGRVALPEGTPAGEVIELVAFGRKFKSSGLGEYRARVGPDGDFRVAFAGGTRRGRIELESRNLFLPVEVKVDLPKDGSTSMPEELVLWPRLGASLRGKVILPRGAERLRSSVVGKPVQVWAVRGCGMEVEQRYAAIDSRLEFEVRQLEPRVAHEVVVEIEGLAPLAIRNVRVAPGETRRLDLDPSLGARLRGRVVVPGGSMPDRLTLHVDVQTDEAPETETGRELRGIPAGYRGLESTKVDANGSFDVRGVPAGKLTVYATALQRVPAVLELGSVADGDLLEGLELALGMGERISGRVVWPDGSVVVGARILVIDERGYQLRMGTITWFEAGPIKTDANGAFQIDGLEGGPYELSTHASTRDKFPPEERKALRWRAELEHVAPNTSGVELVLREPEGRKFKGRRR